MGRWKKTINTPNLDAISPSSSMYNSDQCAVFSPPHKSAALNQFQKTLLSPINTDSSFCPTSPRSIHAHSRMFPQFSQQEKLQQLRSLSSRDLGSPVSSPWSRWGSLSGKPDWGVNHEELGRFRRSAATEQGSGGREPDVSWVQSLVNTSELNCGINVPAVSAVHGSNSNVQPEGHAVPGAWLDQVQLDQPVAE